jgi:excisionase family DNA binding protein
MDLLTVEEAAKILKIHPVTLRNWLRKGKIQGVKISQREWRIPESALREFIEGAREK